MVDQEQTFTMSEILEAFEYAKNESREYIAKLFNNKNKNLGRNSVNEFQ